MSTKVITTRLTIERNNHDEFHIRVLDNDSDIMIVDVQLTPEQFAMAVSGVVIPDAQSKVSNSLVNVGKKRIIEKRQVLCPVSPVGSTKFLSDWLTEHCQEDGWELNTYLGSQSSVKWVDNGTLLNYSVHKWVETNQENQMENEK